MNRPQKLIIDGYNVIHADEELKRVASGDLNRSRRVLLARLKEYLTDKALHVTVVFDGRGGLTDAESVLPEKLQILFSSSGQSADSLILSILRKSSNPREFIVVTSDVMDIGRTAGTLGAQVVASTDFLQRINQKDPTPRKLVQEKPSPTEDDTAFWLDMFSRGDGHNKNSPDGSS